MVHMTNGAVYIPIVNVGVQEVVLHPCTVLVTVSEAYLVNSPAKHVEEGVAATVSSLATTGLVQDKIAAVDLTALTQKEQCQVRMLLRKYSCLSSL